LYAGIFASDWSWSPLFFDFDNDGNKDLFISNGIPKRLNDIDYINFISNVDLQEKMKSTGLDEKDMNLIDRFPQIKIPNRFFKNGPELRFTDISLEIGNNRIPIQTAPFTQILITTGTWTCWLIILKTRPCFMKIKQR
jgi:hypothetical protein